MTDTEVLRHWDTSWEQARTIIVEHMHPDPALRLRNTTAVWERPGFYHELTRELMRGKKEYLYFNADGQAFLCPEAWWTWWNAENLGFTTYLVVVGTTNDPPTQGIGHLPNVPDLSPSQSLILPGQDAPIAGAPGKAPSIEYRRKI